MLCTVKACVAVRIKYHYIRLGKKIYHFKQCRENHIKISPFCLTVKWHNKDLAIFLYIFIDENMFSFENIKLTIDIYLII